MKRTSITIISLMYLLYLLLTSNFAVASDDDWVTSGVNTYVTSGSIGIGTTSPDVQFEVEKNNEGTTFGLITNPVIRITNNRTAAFGSYSELQFGVAGTVVSGIGGKYENWTATNGRGGGLHFFTKNAPTEAVVSEKMTISTTGNVGIGTTNPQSKLAVNGKITAEEVEVITNVAAAEFIVKDTAWSDFVFDNEYKLPELKEVESFIKNKKHLPDIPSAKEIEKRGLSVAEMMAKQMQKIEELTLYVIAQNKEIQGLKKKLADLEERK